MGIRAFTASGMIDLPTEQLSANFVRTPAVCESGGQYWFAPDWWVLYHAPTGIGLFRMRVDQDVDASARGAIDLAAWLEARADWTNVRVVGEVITDDELRLARNAANNLAVAFEILGAGSVTRPLPTIEPRKAATIVRIRRLNETRDLAALRGTLLRMPLLTCGTTTGTRIGSAS